MDELSADLSLRQLEYLVAVVDLGSLTRAAALLSVTQPTVSHQLAALERSAGVALLAREGRAVRPTEAGRALADAGREVLEVGRRGLDRARRTGTAGEVVEVGVVASLAATILPPALAAWHRAEPGVEVRVREHLRRDDLAASVVAGRADVGIGAPPPRAPGRVQPLGQERYVVVAPPALGLGPGSVAPASLAPHEWVLFTPDHGLHDLVQEVCAAAGFSPRAAVRTGQIDTAVRLAAAGLGPALVPAISVPSDLAALARPLRPAVARPVAAFGPGLDRPAVRRLLALLTPTRTGLDPP